MAMTGFLLGGNQLGIVPLNMGHGAVAKTNGFQKRVVACPKKQVSRVDHDLPEVHHKHGFQG